MAIKHMQAYNVKDAFIYYWKYHNKSKKFILAGHGQRQIMLKDY